jgi:hypothetical protein
LALSHWRWGELGAGSWWSLFSDSIDSNLSPQSFREEQLGFSFYSSVNILNFKNGAYHYPSEV